MIHKNYGNMFLAILFVAVFFSGCTMAAPDAGFEAVLIEKPLIFGHGGVVNTPIKTGRTITWVTTNVVLVDVRPLQFEEKFDDLMSRDGVPLDFDSFVRLRIIGSVSLVQNFGADWYGRNVQAEFRNYVRQAVRKHGMNETAINTTSIEAIDREISVGMIEYINRTKMPIELVGVTVGKANPPDAIKDQRVQTAQQQQRILTENERKKAEDAKKAAEVARAVADTAYREAMNFSIPQYLQFETLRTWRETCKTNTCVFSAQVAGVAPVIALNNKTETK